MFTMFEDLGHAWLRVDEATARSVGLEPASFSQFSYRHAHWLYLEEDCDAGLFVAAYQKKIGHPPHIVGRYSERNSVIRNYDRIK